MPGFPKCLVEAAVSARRRGNPTKVVGGDSVHWLINSLTYFFSMPLRGLYATTLITEKDVIPAPVFPGINSSRACPALDAGNPGFLDTGSLFSQGQAWIPTGVYP